MPHASHRSHALRRWAWLTATIVYLQLIAGATLRHLGAGLAIPTFPRATADGAWLPNVHTALVHLHFTHSRLGALLVTGCIIALVASAARTREPYLVRPALLLAALLVAQVSLGIFVIWQMRPPLLTTLHVVNGAALLATIVLLAIRASPRPEVPARSRAAALSELHA